MTIASENPTDKMQDMLCSLSRNWWAFVLRGVLALIIAVLAFVMPAEALLALTLVFGAFDLELLSAISTFTAAAPSGSEDTFLTVMLSMYATPFDSAL